MRTKNKFLTQKMKPLAAVLATTLFAVPFAYGLAIEEDFTKGQTKNKWLMPDASGGVSSDSSRSATNKACLTATTAGAKTASPTVAGTPGKCDVYDPDGKGALRLTPADKVQVGGIVSDFTFPTNEGVDISFITYTWSNVASTGADGMSFYLADGSRPPTMGGAGGSLGYTCSNINPLFESVDGGYLGIGIDEYGNYLNGAEPSAPWVIPGYIGDNTNTGIPDRQAWGPLDAVGGLRAPNVIGIRGKTNMSYGYLGNQWLKDVYAARGWTWDSTAEAKLAAYKNEFWGGGSAAKRAEHIRWACKNGQQNIAAKYLPSGQGPLNFKADIDNVRKDANGKPLLGELYNGKYLAHARIPETLYSKVDSRAKAKPISYRIKIDKNGIGSVWYAFNGGEYQPIILNKDLVKINGPLPETFRFGFAGSTGGSVNNHEVTCFKVTSATESQGNASTNLPNSEILENSQVYLSLFNNYYWTGQVQAKNMALVNRKLVVNSVAEWDAACLLDGGSYDDTAVSAFLRGQCKSTNKSVNPNPNYNDRITWTWNGNGGVSMDWGNLSAAQQQALQQTGEPVTTAQARLEYLKGDRSNEQTNVGVGLFRFRRSVMGDVINSSPVWVGYPDSKYENNDFTDRRHGTAGAEKSGESYSTFRSNHRTRSSVVYAGSNDGFMHGFRAGTHKADGTIDLSTSDGHEMLAYMPGSVLQRITRPESRGGSVVNALDFSNTNYAHNYYNDSTVGIGDVFYMGKWHTLLMSGLGAGGNSVYMLDVTEPDSFSKTNANSRVIGEWSYNAGDSVWKNLGNTYGTPVFGRFHDGSWGAVFGNGWCNTADEANGNCTANDGPAGIYVMTIDQTSGQPSFRFISTNVGGTKAEPNGIAHVTPFDVDGDAIYDYAYAGDVKGNIWRFDLTSNDRNQWATVAPQKLFTTRAGQPISTKVVVSKHKKVADNDVVLTFGTGIKNNGYLDRKTTYATGVQSLYGLRDRSANTFGTATAVVNDSDQTNPVHLLKQSISPVDNKLSTADIDWSKHSGWFMDLGSVKNSDGTTSYEQLIYDMHLEKERYVVANTFIDAKTASLTCDSTPQTGYTYPLNVGSGKAITGFFVEHGSTVAIRQQYNNTGTSKILYAQSGDAYLLNKAITGELSTERVHLPDDPAVLKRLSWREIF